jgi:hypothetical protein
LGRRVWKRIIPNGQINYVCAGENLIRETLTNERGPSRGSMSTFRVPWSR